MHARGRLSSTSCARTTFPPRCARPWKSGPFRACPELAEGATSIMPNHCGLQPLRNAVASLRSEVRGLRSASFLLPLSFHTPRRIQFLVLRGIFLVRQQLAMIFRRAVHAVKEIGQNEFVLPSLLRRHVSRALQSAQLGLELRIRLDNDFQRLANVVPAVDV